MTVQCDNKRYVAVIDGVYLIQFSTYEFDAVAHRPNTKRKGHISLNFAR